MTYVLYRISRYACPRRERPWIDAIYAEAQALEGGHARVLWLLGGIRLAAGRRLRGMAVAASPLTLACLAAAVAFAVMGITEYEGLAVEDDWYPAFSAASVLALIASLLFHRKRPTPEAWP